MPNSSRTLDDFTVPEEVREMVTQHRPRIEHLFGVELNILGVPGSVQSPNRDPQGARKIWLQLQGHRDSLQRAKEYIKGLCAPELSEEVHYSKDMQCIFSGAQGLFLDCLTQGTSAHLTEVRPGALLISGLAEAFVMAQSRIQEFVEKHQKNPKLPEEREVQVKRTFRDLVENYDDKHAMDLLILPTAVKEELLNLVKEIQEASPSFGENSSLESETGTLATGGSGLEPQKRLQNTLGTPAELCRIQDPIRTNSSGVDMPAGFPSPPESPQKSQGPTQPHGSARFRDVRTSLPPMADRPQEQSLPQASRIGFPQGLAESEWHARPQDFMSSLNGPQAWPETTAVLRPALPRSSPKPILGAKTPPKASVFPGLVESREENLNQRRDSLSRRESSPASLPERSEEEPSSNVQLSSWTEKEFRMRLNFFKTMGYEEQVVRKVLLEGGVREAPSTILDRVQMAEASLSQQENMGLPRLELGGKGPSPSPPEQKQDENEYVRELIKAAVANCGHSPSEIPTEIQTGAPLADLLRRLHEKGEQENETEGAAETSAAKLEPEEPFGIRSASTSDQRESHQQRPGWEGSRGSPFREGTWVSPVHPEVAASPPGSSPAAHPTFAPSEAMGNFPTQSPSLGPSLKSSVPTVTGAQRFEEALQTEFQLRLLDVPGKKNLRGVIIDGSNVAMMHGLKQFFSCRGIALAVQYFWDRGHREVSVLVPEHRMEECPNVREKHYMDELIKLNILSLTPSRKIDGKGVVPYDDRLMLRLAEQTNGVIVTNDQFRDLAKESKKWARIIKESLLQYIFVGNIFMVPDDPLGREGPTLAEFLKKSPGTKAMNCHSFSGRSVPTPVPMRPASQTEVLQLRDRRPPGGLSSSPKRGATPEKERFRPKAETERLRRELLEIFVDQDKKVDFVLMREPSCQDLNKLSEAILNLTF
uniref:Protein KHNYN n=1 Tax=Pogona vitticeps TaxID=103695 RepID=A0ABM5EIU6_9SAUR